MGQIFLKDKDGLTQGFTIAGDTPSASEAQRIQASLSGAPDKPEAPPTDDRGIFSLLGTGIAGGYYQSKAGAMGLGALAARNISADGKFAGYTPEELDAARLEAKKASEEYEPPAGSFFDQKTLYDKTKYLSYQFGQSLPATALGIVGAVAGTAVAPGIGTVGGFIAGAGGAGVASVPQNYEQNLEEQEQTYGKITNPNKAFAGSLIQSALEGTADRATMGVAGFLAPAARPIVDAAVKGALGKAALKVGESTLTGFSTEAVTEAIQQGVQRWQADKPLGNEEAQKEYLENAIVGGLLGGVTGGAFGTAGVALDLKQKSKLDLIRKDLEAQDNVGNNIEANRKARLRQASARLNMEDDLNAAHGPLLEDLRPSQDLLSGPKTVMRESANVPPAPETAEGPQPPKQSPVASAPQPFSTQEYSDAVAKMTGEKLISADKIRTTLRFGHNKAGNNKANAIFNEMMKRGDAVTAGSKGQYLTVVQNAATNIKDEPSTSDKISRLYEVRPIAQEDVKPFNVLAQGGRKVGPDFKTAEEAFAFADAHKIGDHVVTQNQTPNQYGVYEVTSGVTGQKPTSRFVRSFADNQAAIDHVNGLNPKLSPTSNEVQATAREKRVAAKLNEMTDENRAALQKLTDHMLGPGRAFIDLVEAIHGPNGEGLDTGHVIEGQTTIANGMRRIEVAAGINDPHLSPDEFQKAIDSVAHHEVLHVAKAAGLFTPAEWKSLVKRANTRVAGKPYTYLERAQVRTEGAPAGANLDEEAVAEMVRDYMRNPAAFEAAPRSLLRKLLDFVRTLGQYSRDVANGNAVLRDFAEGKIGERNENPSRADLYGTYYSSVKIPGFYLKSAKYFEGLAERNPDQAYPGNQWIGMLKNAQIKPEEMEWLGIVDWLKDQKKVPVRDILQYIAANSIDINEATGSENANADFSPVHGVTTQSGGEDYSEMIFHMPHLQPTFSVGAHFDGFPNIIAFGRFKTRTIDGKKTLFIEEMQSDLHQRGKKYGYSSGTDVRMMEEMRARGEQLRVEFNRVMIGSAGRDFTQEEIDRGKELRRLIQENDQAMMELGKVSEIPNAPLKTTWSDFVVKRLVRYAADNGHEAITWNAEPEGVAQTEKYGQLEEPNDEGRILTQYGNDVTGIVNFYTKRLAKDIEKLFNKQAFGNPTPRIVPRVESSGADLNLEELFPTKDDFFMVMQELGSLAKAEDPEWGKVYAKAIQIARQQRSFDAQDALHKSGLLNGGRFIDDFNGAFPEYAIENTASATLDAGGNPNVARWIMDLTPELKEAAQGEGFPLFSSVQKRTAPDTPEFRNWFAGSKVRGDDGKPITVYHGTFTDFDRFQHGIGHGYYGAGFYFSDNPGDASSYASENNGDFMTKVNDEVERRLNDPDIAEQYYRREGELYRVVADEMQDHKGAVIPAYLSIQNPIYFGGPNETKFDGPMREKFINGLHKVEGDYLNVDPEKLVKDFKHNYDDDEVLGADDFRRAVLHSGGLMDAIDPWSGMEAGPEVMRKAFQAMGFDGIIDDQVSNRFRSHGLTPGTTHYIAFEPSQVKSVNNSGAFNPKDNRYMFSSVRPAYSATAPMGQRVPQQVPVDRVAQIEARITYNNIAPMLEKLLRGKGKIGLSKQRAQSIAEGTVFALQDINQPIAKLIDRVRANGGSISDETDTYLRQQLMTGEIEDTINRSKKAVYDPLIHAVQKLNVTQRDVDEIKARHPSNIQTVNGVPYQRAAVRNILDNYADPKMALAELYLYAQHAKERNAVMRDRNRNLIGERPEQFDAGSGMSDVEANDVLQWFGSKPFGNTFSDLSNPNSIRSLYRKLISHTNDIRVAGGLNPDFRKMFDINGDPVDKYQDYAPLRGYTDNNPDHQDEISKAFARTGKRMNISGKEDKAAVGRASEAANLIANAILQNEEAIVRSAKNRVGQTFLNMLKTNMGVTLPNGPNSMPNTVSDFAEVVPMTAKKPMYDAKSGVVRMATTTTRMDPDMMIVKINGQETGIRIKDPRLRQALLGNTMLGEGGMRSLINGLLKLNRFLAAVRTSYNPEFLVSNFFRDFGAAQLNLSEYDLKGLRGDIMKSVLPAIRGVYRGLRDSSVNDPWKTVFDDFQAHGAKTAFYGTRDLDTTIKRVMDELSTDPQGKVEKIKDKIGAIGRLIEAQNDAIENGIRVATYKHMIDKLLAISNNPTNPAEIERIKNRAAYAAKNLTVNFNMGGSQKPILNALYLFFNASLQGSAALVNPLIRSRKVRHLWLSAVAAGALQDIILSALSPVSPDGEKEYDKIPDYVLQTNMIFLNPMSEKGYFKIPMPYLFNAAWNSGRAIMRGIRGGYTQGQTLNSVMGTAIDSLNPWGSGGSFLNFVAPTVVDPLVDLTTNTNFAGAPIAPEKSNFSSVDLPAQRYWNNTSPVYTTVANMLDKASGGDGVFKGAVSYSPNQYEYMTDFLGGGAMTTVVRAWDLVSPNGNIAKAVKGDEVSANDIPFLRRFVGNLTSREDLNAYIENRDKVLTVRSALKEALKAGDTEAYQKIIQKYPDEYRAVSRINAFETRRQKLGAQIKKINGNSKLTADEKKKLVEPLKQHQEDLVNQANAFMNK